MNPMLASRQLNSATPPQCMSAALAATILPGAAVAVVTGSMMVGSLIFVVAFVHAIALGLPIYCLLRWKKAANVITSAVAGLVVGAGPVAILLFPGGGGYKGVSSWSGNVAQRIDGVTTEAGWNSYYALVGQFGGFGTASGLLFALFLAWRLRDEA